MDKDNITIFAKDKLHLGNKSKQVWLILLSVCIIFAKA